MLWGHTTDCGCPVCRSLNRIFPLVSAGSDTPGFLQRTGDRLRVLEGELRDEVGPLLLARVPGQPFKCFGPSILERQSGGKGAPPEPAELQGPTGEPLLPAFVKGAATPPAPNTGPLSPPKPVKEEAAREAEESKDPIAEVGKKDAERDRKRRRRRREDKGKQKKRSKRTSSSESEREPDPPAEEEPPNRVSPKASKRERSPLPRPRGVEEPPKRKRERSSSSSPCRPRAKGDKRSPTPKGGKEKKAHPREEDKSWVRSDPQERYPGTTAAPKAYNSFWRGEVPVSDHPRWKQGRKKGITKVIKQELRARNHRGRGWRR